MITSDSSSVFLWFVIVGSWVSGLSANLFIGQMLMLWRICFSSCENWSPSFRRPVFESFAQIIVLMRAVICGALNEFRFLNSSSLASEM